MNDVLENIGTYLDEEIKKELLSQGHHASGQLLDSITHKVKSASGQLVLEGEMLGYGHFVDTGRRKKARKVPIDALIEWIRLKKFESDAKKVRGMAFAIQRTIFEKGISTAESWKGTSTKDFLTKTLNANEARILADIDKSIADKITVMFENIIRNIQKQWQ